MELIIIGAGGFGLEIAAYVEDLAQHQPGLRIKGFVDDQRPAGTFHADYPILGATTMPPDQDAYYLLAIGQPERRQALAAAFAARGVHWARFMHPRAQVATSAQIGSGCVIAPFACIGPAANLGDHAVINAHATVAHEAQIGAYSVLAPYVHINGAAQIGEAVSIGSHAVVARGCRVGAGAVITAGMMINIDVPNASLVVERKDSRDRQA